VNSINAEIRRSAYAAEPHLQWIIDGQPLERSGGRVPARPQPVCGGAGGVVLAAAQRQQYFYFNFAVSAIE
jgi:hypothetical protein